jgi:hypothetical protein
MGRFLRQDRLQVGGVLLSELDSAKLRNPVFGDIWFANSTPMLRVGRVGKRYLRYSMSYSDNGELSLEVPDSGCSVVPIFKLSSVLEAALQSVQGSQLVCFRPFGV